MENRVESSASAITAGMYSGRVFENAGFPALLELIRPNERRILDVGCGAGANGRLLAMQGKTVYGITISSKEAEVARQFLADVICGDIESMPLDYPTGYFDAVILSHVLEHLIDPWQVLRRLSSYIRPGGHIYVALPNVAFYQERFKILLGRFRYADAGIVDRLHLRFFTFQTAQELVRETGYRVVTAKGLGAIPLWPLRRWIGKSTPLDRWACALFPNVFSFHIIVVGERV